MSSSSHTYSGPVSCVQAWYYFTHQNDTWPIKLLVRKDFCIQVVITFFKLTHPLGQRRYVLRHSTSGSNHTHWYEYIRKLTSKADTITYPSVYIHCHELGKPGRTSKTCLVSVFILPS